MKWFKHQSDANLNAKLQEIILDHGMEGYGLYWFCIELVAMNVTSSKLTFELEHDARIISRMTGLQVAKVEVIMKDFISLDLFSASEGRIQCLKLAKRCDDFTAKAIRQNGLQAIDSNGVLESPTKSEKVPLEDRSKKVEVRKEIEVEDKDLLSDNSDAIEVLSYMNEVLSSKYRHTTKSHIGCINARLSEGFTASDLKMVVDSKFSEWGADQKMASYLRPQTLFQAGKFQGYLNAAKVAPAKSKHDLSNIEYTSGGF